MAKTQYSATAAATAARPAASQGRRCGRAAGAGASSASANCVTVANRSAGTFSSARKIACSTDAGTLRRTVRSGGTGSLKWRARIAWGVDPVNGGLPASISYDTQPRL